MEPEQIVDEGAAADPGQAVVDQVRLDQARKALDRDSQGHQHPGRNTNLVVRTVRP